MTVVPDSIEPVEEWRTWSFDGNHLLSHNGATWLPGEPHKASCLGGQATRYVWTFARVGMTRDQAAQHASYYNQQSHYGTTYMSNSMTASVSRQWIASPRVEPPTGYGYVLEPVTHNSPDANCSCGIYAGHSLDVCPPGDVAGKVKLWGTVIPGTKGSRAQYAYPSELHVPARLADDPALLAYGVPIVALTEQEAASHVAVMTPPTRRTPRSLRIAIAVNFACAAANLTALGMRYLL